MQENFNQKADKFQIIGHGIGAHAAGEAGSKIPGLARITGDRYENIFCFVFNDNDKKYAFSPKISNIDMICKI